MEYEQALVTYIDILGFGELVHSKGAGEISKILRVFTEAVEPDWFKPPIPEIPVPKDQFITFSDLSITMAPMRSLAKSPPRGRVFYELLRLIHAQAVLIFDYGIVVRGGVTVGQATKSYGRIFGPAVIRAYEIESKEATYPRIVVDQSVLDEVEINHGLWVHDKESELKAVNGFLRRDKEDGLLYVDYLRVMREELNDPSDYDGYLRRYGVFVRGKLKQYEKCEKIRRKYEWLDRYHKLTVKSLTNSLKSPKKSS